MNSAVMSPLPNLLVNLPNAPLPRPPSVPRPHSSLVPQRMIRDLARETDNRAWGRRPVYKRRSIRPDDALKELRDDGDGEFGSAAAPDVCTAVWGIGDGSAGD